ncbi:MAG: hypothetical protein V1750_09410 [Acidobacteriota bacterium]
MNRTPVVVFAGLSLALATSAAGRGSVLGPPGKPAADMCTTCHLELDEVRLQAPAAAAEQDTHHRQGITCAGCHGGDPSSDDAAVAMDPGSGFIGRPQPQRIPQVCGSCHSQASFMLRYAPNIPTDQLAQYQTSRHGQALAKGDEKVATCASCHGAHGILPPDDARSPTYPTRIVETCGKCHGNATLMAGYGIKGNELEEYAHSVHFNALAKKNDLSAPTCNDCHGSHGATPPGVDSVSSVCGNCHLTQREQFDVSPHKDAFAAMGQPACEACHGNHAILEPQDRWIGVGAGGVCGGCHSAGDPGAVAAESLGKAITGAADALAAASVRVKKAERAGMLMEEATVRLEDAHQTLVLARNEIHTANPKLVVVQSQASLASTRAADALAANAEREIRFRRTGLLVSLGVIVLAMLALALKISSMER